MWILEQPWDDDRLLPNLGTSSEPHCLHECVWCEATLSVAVL